MVTFRKIDQENFDSILKMDPGDGGRFVAPNAVSLAQAWLRYEDHDTYPFAVYHEEEPVGFLMAREDLSRKAIFLWRLAIAKEHQGKGYGTAALRKFLDLARESGKYACAVIGFVEGNDRAGRLYEKAGFRPVGKGENGETILRLDL